MYNVITVGLPIENLLGERADEVGNAEHVVPAGHEEKPRAVLGLDSVSNHRYKHHYESVNSTETKGS